VTGKVGEEGRDGRREDDVVDIVKYGDDEDLGFEDEQQ
jgi:hypothetical protein